MFYFSVRILSVFLTAVYAASQDDVTDLLQAVEPHPDTKLEPPQTTPSEPPAAPLAEAPEEPAMLRSEDSISDSDTALSMFDDIAPGLFDRSKILKDWSFNVTDFRMLRENVIAERATMSTNATSRTNVPWSEGAFLQYHYMRMMSDVAMDWSCKAAMSGVLGLSNFMRLLSGWRYGNSCGMGNGQFDDKHVRLSKIRNQRCGPGLRGASKLVSINGEESVVCDDHGLDQCCAKHDFGRVTLRTSLFGTVTLPVMECRVNLELDQCAKNAQAKCMAGDSSGDGVDDEASSADGTRCIMRHLPCLASVDHKAKWRIFWPSDEGDAYKLPFKYDTFEEFDHYTAQTARWMPLTDANVTTWKLPFWGASMLSINTTFDKDSSVLSTNTTISNKDVDVNARDVLEEAHEVLDAASESAASTQEILLASNLSSAEEEAKRALEEVEQRKQELLQAQLLREAQEEAERLKALEEEAARKKAEMEEIERAEKEALERKKREEEERRKREEEEAARRRAEEEEARRREAEEEAAREAAEQKRLAEEEAARRQAEDEELAREMLDKWEKASEMAHDEVSARRDSAMEAKRKRAEAEEVARKKAEQEEDEAARMFFEGEDDEWDGSGQSAIDEAVERAKSTVEVRAKRAQAEEQALKKAAMEEEEARRASGSDLASDGTGDSALEEAISRMNDAIEARQSRALGEEAARRKAEEESMEYTSEEEESGVVLAGQPNGEGRRIHHHKMERIDGNETAQDLFVEVEQSNITGEDAMREALERKMLALKAKRARVQAEESAKKQAEQNEVQEDADEESDEAESSGASALEEAMERKRISEEARRNRVLAEDAARRDAEQEDRSTAQEVAQEETSGRAAEEEALARRSTALEAKRRRQEEEEIARKKAELDSEERKELL